MNQKIPIDYSGFIPGQLPGMIAGVSSPVGLAMLLYSRDWKPYSSRHEKQNMGFETSACLLFSILDAIESLLNWMLQDGQFDEELVNWLTVNGYIVNGKFDFSDRYAAQFADIIPLTGTMQYKAANAVTTGPDRIARLIPEAMLPYTAKGEYKNPDATPGGYYDKSVLTAQMEALATEFSKRIKINWYYVENPSEALYSSPLSATVRYADGSGILKPEGRLNHGIMVPSQASDFYDIDDSYNDQYKRYGKDYVLNFIGFKITINKTTMDIKKFTTDNDLAWVQNEASGQFGRIMQGKLRPITSKDRGALILLDEKVRSNQITKDGKKMPAKLTEAEWKVLPKLDF